MLYKINLLINKIKNAINIKNKYIFFPYIKYIIKILFILKKEGYIYNFIIINNIFFYKRKIKIYLKYINNISVINKIKLISKSSRRVYVKYKNIPIIKNNYGISILSTSKDILTNKNSILYKIGGEYLFYIY
ncbi:MAG: uS8 family ribosomal protein [Candidatus Shikimatogenerans sp. Tder]|uniref:Small ribosomal subunit protein uS8 n=1 Tax=Candidatus Shikimatogenerans sp. Tder TaxID=3158566 RepID=A0AAU7QRZ0_9FLAO